MLRYVYLFAGLSIASINHAAQITYAGYTLDTESNIVSGGGLEWLQWDQTAGQSPAAALANYDTAGWRIASNTEMAELFNSFGFGLTFQADENATQLVLLPGEPNNFGTADHFIQLFGDTYSAAGFALNEGDPFEYSAAIFGEDLDGDGRLNRASVNGTYIEAGNNFPGEAWLSSDWARPDIAYEPFYGVALVREVPLPAAAWLFLSAIGGLGISNRVRK